MLITVEQQISMTENFHNFQPHTIHVQEIFANFRLGEILSFKMSPCLLISDNLVKVFDLYCMMVIFASMKHSEEKGCQNGAPGVLLLQMVPFFSKGHSFFLNNHVCGKKSTPSGQGHFS